MLENTEQEMLITAEKAIDILREKVADVNLHPSKMALTVGDLRNLLDRIKTEGIGLAQVKAGIINMLKVYGQHNPNGDGLPMPFIWTRLRENGNNISNTMVENALAALLKEGAIESKEEGLTFYRYVTETGGDATL